VKNAKFGLNFRPHSPLSRPGFETEQIYKKFGSGDDRPTFYSNLVYSSVRFPLKTIG